MRRSPSRSHRLNEGFAVAQMREVVRGWWRCPIRVDLGFSGWTCRRRSRRKTKKNPSDRVQNRLELPLVLGRWAGRSQFSSNRRADGLVCLAVAGSCFSTCRSRSLGTRTSANRLSSLSNGRRGAIGTVRSKRFAAVYVRAARGAPATPPRAYSSIGQSPRLITGLFLVRVQVGLCLFSGARSRTST